MAQTVEQRFFNAVLRASRVWRRHADAVAAEFGLTEATALPMLHLARMEKEPRQADLAQAMGIERPSVAWLVDQLCEAGLVERRGDPSDKRARIVHLTDKGRAVTQAIQDRLETQRRAVMAAVSRQDIEAGLRVLEAVAAAARLPQ